MLTFRLIHLGCVQRPPELQGVRYQSFAAAAARGVESAVGGGVSVWARMDKSVAHEG